MALGEEDAAALLKYMNPALSEVEDLEEAKKLVAQSWVSRKAAPEDPEIKSAVIGKVTGAISGKNYAVARDTFKLDVKREEFDKLTPEEQIVLIGEKVSASHAEAITKAEGTSAKTTEEIREQFKKEMEGREQEYERVKALYEGLQETSKKELESKEFEMHSYKKQQEESKLFSSLKIKRETKLEQAAAKGMESEFREKYDTDLQEVDGKPAIVLYEKGTKTRPLSTTNGSEFATPTEVLTKMASDLGVLEINPHGETKAPGATKNPFESIAKAAEAGKEQKPNFAVHPNAQ